MLKNQQKNTKMNLLIKNKGGNPLPETTLKNKAKT